jgi:hypothetical protein
MTPVSIRQAARWCPEGCGRLGERGREYPEGLPAWNDVCARPYERFPRLDPLSKLVNILAEWVLETQPVSPDTGMLLATRFGCVEADLAYYRTAAAAPALASPQLFPYTLPSSGLAEAAIRHRLHGPAAVWLQDDTLGAALGQARRWLTAGEAPECLVVQADALLAGGGAFLQTRPRVEGWAFLLGTGAGRWPVEKALPGAGQPAAWFAELEKSLKQA